MVGFLCNVARYLKLAHHWHFFTAFTTFWKRTYSLHSHLLCVRQYQVCFSLCFRQFLNWPVQPWQRQTHFHLWFLHINIRLIHCYTYITTNTGCVISKKVPIHYFQCSFVSVKYYWDQNEMGKASRIQLSHAPDLFLFEGTCPRVLPLSLYSNAFVCDMKSNTVVSSINLERSTVTQERAYIFFFM